MFLKYLQILSFKLVIFFKGGTADYSVHEVEEGGTLTELYRASGEPYEGIYEDREYLKICTKPYLETDLLIS